mmetsp:Transcript_30666/g.34223  ORF Transcript_30666/g.34223 Transcript_30666/m.34223 type:complete len:205 (+) Transcript_30666:180-794(+)
MSTKQSCCCHFFTLPKELQLVIADLDFDAYFAMPLLCKQTATITRFDREFNKHGKWQKRRTTSQRDSLDGVSVSQIVCREYWRHGKRHGDFRNWHNNGQLQRKQFYVDGRLEGDVKYWYEDGQLHRHFNFVDGKLEGVFKQWHSNGKIWEEHNYVKGKLEGELKMWFCNGQLRRKCCYVDDKLKGEYKNWNEVGELVDRGVVQI